MRKKSIGDVLTAKEAARYVRLTLATFYRYIWEGKIEAPKIGGRYRFTKSLLDRWLGKKVSGVDDVSGEDSLEGVQTSDELAADIDGGDASDGASA